MKKLLIFDLDGTLADTLPSIRHAINLMLSHFEYPEKSYEDVRAAIGNGALKLVERLLPEERSLNKEILSEAFACYEKMYDTTYIEADRCYDGISEALAELYRRGYTLAVLSNKQDTYVKPIVSNITEKGLVSLALGQREGFPRKPDPTVPCLIAKELGFSLEDCVFIGDSEVDIETAKNAGMVSVGCSWGYREREVLVELEADFIIDKPEELLDIFE